MVQRASIQRNWPRHAAGLMLLAFPLVACGSLQGTDAADIEKAKQVISGSLIDPSSVEFRNTRERKGWVCGELNAKNRMGAYVGFKRFTVDVASGAGLVDPEFDFSDLVDAQERCRSLGSGSACDRAAEQVASQVTQVRFDREWSNNCDAIHSRSVYQPPLNGPANEAVEVEGPDPEVTSEPPTLDAGSTVDEEANPSPAQPVAEPAPASADQRWLDGVLNRSASADNTTDAVETED